MAPSHLNPAASATERAPLLRNLSPPIGLPGRPWSTSVLTFAARIFAALSVLWLLVDYWDWTQLPLNPLPTYSVAIIGMHYLGQNPALGFIFLFWDEPSNFLQGAGPAGISAAQHLRNSPATRYVHFNITIYESKPVLGGALAFHDVNGSSVFPKDDPMQIPIAAEDVAGTALVWNSALFTQDSEKVLRDKIEFIELGPKQIGYKTPMSTWVQLLWTYGNSVWRGNKLAQDGALQKAIVKVPLVPDVAKIFKSLGVLRPLRQRANDMLRGRSISERYTTDILEPQVQRAYGQGLNKVTGLTAMMAVAQEEFANAYQGENLIQRLRRIVHEIDVEVRTSTRVTGIKYVEIGEKHPAWLIRHESADGGGGNSSIEMFDGVIIAALDFDILLENGEKSVPNLVNYYDIDADAAQAAVREDDYYVPVHITFFTSDAKLSPWDDDEEVLFLEPQKAAGMRELTLVREVFNYQDNSTKAEYLYHVLSIRSVLEVLRSRANITWSYQTKIEKAYPVLSPLQRFPPFKMPWAKGFWWTSIIQRAGTSVDLNWLAGKVAAQGLINEVS
ncbi:hypothetical protein E0Z10_g3923 [Xylaria hypoxylon]|uniref:Prenylcysteine lyase domain-containing protein n=1 Tax=Xylaria hypoxylon TaxID=37992 RepID=A0A4Z0YZC6_9PEZI|nr:hypothetical protein E0Z10_g3923 [Xylaria hypoxylon]